MTEQETIQQLHTLLAQVTSTPLLWRKVRRALRAITKEHVDARAVERGLQMLAGVVKRYQPKAPDQ